MATMDMIFAAGRGGGGGGGPLLSSSLWSMVAMELPLRALTLRKLARAAFISSWAFSSLRMFVSMSETGEIWKKLKLGNEIFLRILRV